MVVPAYTDVSHFRAPYKNSWPYTGISGLGEEVPVGPNGLEEHIEPGQELLHFVLRDEQGRMVYIEEVAEVIVKNLAGARAIWLSDRAVALEPFTAEELAAAAADPGAAEMLAQQSGKTWLEQKLQEGNVVFATPGVVLPQMGAKQLAAVPKEETETVRMTSHIAPILAEPSMLAALMTPAGIAVAAVLGGGVLYLLLRKKRRPTVPARS
jgi:hypothetical protein